MDTHTHTVCWRELKAVCTLTNRGVLFSLSHKHTSRPTQRETVLTQLTHLWAPTKQFFPSFWHKRANSMKRLYGVLRLCNVLIMISMIIWSFSRTQCYELFNKPLNFKFRYVLSCCDIPHNTLHCCIAWIKKKKKNYTNYIKWKSQSIFSCNVKCL